MNATTNHVFVKGTNTLMQCIKCETFDMLGFKKVDHKHPHCVACYKQVQKEKRTLSKCDCCGKKHGENECKGVNCGACNDHDYFPLTFIAGVMRCSFCVDDYNNYTCEVCGEYEYEEVGLSTGENGVEKRVCGRCDIGCCDYNGWGDKEKEEPCKCTDAMDIRGRCGIGEVGFAKCPAFADTACFCICNDSDLDMKIRASEDLGINCTPIITQWLSDHNVPADLHEPILNLYNEWRVDEYESPNVYPYKKCSMCSERKSCGCYQDDEWFCENCAEEEEEDCRTKPCSCGCGYLGGSCDKGLAIDNNECTNCRDSTCDEAYKFYRGAEVMVLCDNCGGDWYNGIFERDGWNRV